MTQKYDMQSLRALQVLEAEFLKDLCSIYSCEEEGKVTLYNGLKCNIIILLNVQILHILDIPAEVDLMEIFNLDQKERQGAMVSIHSVSLN